MFSEEKLLHASDFVVVMVSDKRNFFEHSMYLNTEDDKGALSDSDRMQSYDGSFLESIST